MPMQLQTIQTTQSCTQNKPTDLGKSFNSTMLANCVKQTEFQMELINRFSTLKEIQKEDVNSTIADYWYQIIAFACDDWNK